MYKCGKKPVSQVLLLLVTGLLVACGGTGKNESPASAPTNVELNSNSSATSVVLSEDSHSSSSIFETSSSAANSSSQAAVLEKDTTPPSATHLSLRQLAEKSVTVVWEEATDNTRINTYKIERNGQLVATLNHPAHVFTDIDLQPYTAYTYTIKAVDSSGNDSTLSSPLTVRTLASKPSPNVAGNPTGQRPQVGSSTNSAATTSAKAVSSTPSSVKNGSSKATSSIRSTASTSAKAVSSARSSVRTSSSKAVTSISSTTSSSSKAASSKSLSSNPSSSSALSSAAAKPKTVKITWGSPKQRENGQFLELEEIGGYEIRYRRPSDSQYTHITVKNNETVEYTVDDAADVEFEIAVFDTSGIYSQFVKVSH